MRRGVVTIAKDDVRIDWNAIRAEYIGGDISQRDLAEKYGIQVDKLLRRANKEKWFKDREEARNKSAIKAQQKTADVNADRAVVASRIKLKLLLRLEKEIDALPALIGSESRTSMIERSASKGKDGKTSVKEASKAYKLRDLTSALKDLTDDMTVSDSAGSEILQSLMNLERRANSD
jgi:3-oxoacyl-(acyl-carrier-protein) synthase